MSQTPKSHIFYQPFTFALLLCIFAFLSHFALGILDHYLTHTFSILALGLLLFTLKKHSNTLFLITLTFIFIIALGYTPSGLLYGPASIGIIASVYETNFSETLPWWQKKGKSYKEDQVVRFYLDVIELKSEKKIL